MRDNNGCLVWDGQASKTDPYALDALITAEREGRIAVIHAHVGEDGFRLDETVAAQIPPGTTHVFIFLT